MYRILSLAVLNTFTILSLVYLVMFRILSIMVALAIHTWYVKKGKKNYNSSDVTNV